MLYFYYFKLTKIIKNKINKMDESDPKNFLEQLNKEKEIIEKYIKQLEESIKDNETKYLQNTVNGGNILRGWEHIFTSKSNKIHMGNQINNKKPPHTSNSEKLFSQTFDFDKNIEEIINDNEKHHHVSQSVSVNTSNNNLKLEENNNKNISGSVNNINANGNVNKNTNHKHKKMLSLKRKRNNINSESNQNDKQDT